MAATGLYEKSRRLAAGRPVTLSDMLFVRVRSGGQIAFVGLLLCLLMVLWNRAATLLYALADRGKQRGLATLCLGGGDAVALSVSRV